MKRNKGRNKLPEETERNRYENLRGDNRKLRKEVQRLRKENAKLRGREIELADMLNEEPESEMLDIEKTLNCPKCGSVDIQIITKLRGDTDYYFCNNPVCNARGPVSEQNS